MSSFQSMDLADIGVFGGSGFYQFLEEVQTFTVETPYGSPSDKYFISKIGDKRVAFLPRHGSGHSIPPQMINYRANLWGMKQLGVQKIISPCAVGSLQKEIAPGSFVVLDQYVDRTKGRADTFYEGPIATHISAAEPYSERLRQIAIQTGKDLGLIMHDKGTVVVIQGPRFSTRSESQWFTKMGWETINMTQYPEVHLAKELEIETLGLALVTDYDCGLVGEVPAVTHEQVMEVFAANLSNLRKLLFELIKRFPVGDSIWKDKVIKSSRFV
ncbi:MAG: S-methyl-5'-thioadenosine phosphorylase [Candidatus Caenarcaniphilales bacterium]|nr:S-methyl-5'-thioadenosine phosphorylase [Candidatus Caenarcaniphilales bacterium]